MKPQGNSKMGPNVTTRNAAAKGGVGDNSGNAAGDGKPPNGGGADGDGEKKRKSKGNSQSLSN